MRLLPRRLRPGEEATLVEHLGELRARLVVSLLAIVVCFGFTYAFRAHLIHWLVQPLPVHKRHLLTFSPAEPFITSFMIAFWASFVLSLPIIIWQIWGFFAPAFQKHTQRVVAAFSVFSAAMLAGGILFGYFVVMKPAVHFLTNYDKTHYQIQIQAKMLVNAATTPGTPFSGESANNPGARDQIAPPASSECQHEMPQFRGLRKLRYRQSLSVANFQHGEIGGRIASGNRRWNRLTWLHDYAHLVSAANRVFGSHNDSLSPLDAAGHHSMPAMNGHYGTAHLLRSTRDFIR